MLQGKKIAAAEKHLITIARVGVGVRLRPANPNPRMNTDERILFDASCWKHGRKHPPSQKPRGWGARPLVGSESGPAPLQVGCSAVKIVVRILFAKSGHSACYIELRGKIQFMARTEPKCRKIAER